MRVRLFSLSLTGTTFSLFSSLAPNSVRFWNELEQKYHDHFYNGDNETKLTDLTSVMQGRDESIHKYFKRFKNIKNRCFNLSLSEKDLVELALAGLHSNYREKLHGTDHYSINQLHVRALGQDVRFIREKTSIRLIFQIHILLNITLIHQTMRIKRCMPQQPNLVLVHLLSRLKRIGKKR